MPMYKHITIAIALGILLAGCINTNSELDCRSGTEGITARFSNQHFPDTIRPGVPTPLLIDITNNGATTSQSVVRLSYNPDFFFNHTPRTAAYTIVGKEQYNRCKGTTQRHQFVIEAFPLPPTVSSFERPLTLDICYHYGTNITAQICIEPMRDSIDAVEPNCRSNDIQFTGGQGGPLSITKIGAPIYYEQAGIANVRIPVHLQNHGGGTIIAAPGIDQEDFEAACGFGPTIENYAYVKPLLDGSSEGFDCRIIEGLHGTETPVNKVFLRYDPERVEVDSGEYETIKNHYFECLVENVTFDEARTATLDLELYYYYREQRSEQRETTVRKI
jgi:hypothetical protein